MTGRNELVEVKENNKKLHEQLGVLQNELSKYENEKNNMMKELEQYTKEKNNLLNILNEKNEEINGKLNKEKELTLILHTNIYRKPIYLCENIFLFILYQ